MTVGENIRRIRKERGLTLKQLGDMVGVSEAYIRAYESGRRNPKLKSLETLAQALAKEDILKKWLTRIKRYGNIMSVSKETQQNQKI